MPPELLALLRRLVGDAPDVAIPQLSSIAMPRAGRFVPGFKAGWDAMVQGFQPEVDRFCLAVRDLAFWGGIEKGASWGFLIGLIVGIGAGVALTAKIVQVMSQAHAMRTPR